MYPGNEQFFYEYPQYRQEGLDYQHHDERLYPFITSMLGWGGQQGQSPWGPQPGHGGSQWGPPTPPPWQPPSPWGPQPSPGPGPWSPQPPRPPGPPGHGQDGPPSGPPPAFTPQKSQQVGVFAVDPGAIRGCLYRFTYVWLTNRQQFWFYPTFVGRRSISGYRWNGWMWVYFGTDLRSIESFQCT